MSRLQKLPLPFTGLATAIVTPFLRNGEIDLRALEHIVRQQLDAGVDALVPAGSTGEAATLSHDEQYKLIQYVVSIVAGQVPVIAGTGSNSTAEAIRLTEAARNVGASGALLISPYYNKPTQKGIELHYLAVAHTVPDFPLIVYNIPGRTANLIEATTIARLAERPNIVAVKDSTAGLDQVRLVHELCGDAMAIYSGDDARTLEIMKLGGKGLISVTSNLLPKQMRELIQAMQQADWPLAQIMHDQLEVIMTALFLETNPIPIKAAMAMLGYCRNELRLPMTPMSPGPRRKLRRVLQEMRLID